MIDAAARRAFLAGLEGLKGGRLAVEYAGESGVFGDGQGELTAVLRVHDHRFFRRVLLGGDVAFGEAYRDGLWSSPDLVPLIRLAVRNLHNLELQRPWATLLGRLADRVAHLLRANTVRGSRRNIAAHYDLSNEFFRLFLDERMVYSCAWYEDTANSLDAAQWNKLERVCRKLELRSGDHLLEIGCGWGALAVHAATRYRCRVTGVTISREQFEHASELVRQQGLAGQVSIVLEDYRRLRGRFDKIASIEMFEAVGFDYYDAFFAACDRLLAPDGTMLLQTITINEQTFAAYRRRCDFIQKHIFPGSELASLAGIAASLGRATALGVYHAEDMGVHYARTLAAWRARFLARRAEVSALGFDDRFIRLWDYYLAYCEGAFLERHISDVQLLLAKTGRARPLWNEPWREGVLDPRAHIPA